LKLSHRQAPSAPRLPGAITQRVHALGQLVDVEIVRLLLDRGDIGGGIAVPINLLRADWRQAGTAGEKST